ncbi:MFS transporter [Stenotrophomonas acidaminiphila]|jgi:MFS family permease|uniref:MFS transporter n=1 Tax=Stenotrophomonas acidaminiphila TaxID=128780 RepID=UPI000BD568E8|nr:MFS transporter [Stenotrophomonas acidaminiphila]OZB67352.1 MAG: MFS transporter [Xanthomonadales bacterium 14-68-21]
MFDILANLTFRKLFAAQVIALLGTGLTTVALALLAYDLAGAQAGQVLGLALAIKMTVYVLLSPVSGAVVPPEHRKKVLIGLDVVRALVVLALPFVTQIWQIYVLIAVMQSASACFTPLFQSVIPQILPEEAQYTRALSLSRLAYDLESLLSPALAAALLTVIAFQGLFVGTSVGFMLSALLVLLTTFPVVTRTASSGGPYDRALRGMKIYLRTPRLRGLLLLNLCAAAGGAMVFVNTVVLARTVLQGGERQVAWLLAAFGIGSMLVALFLPRLLDRIADRRIMLAASMAMTLVLMGASLYWYAVDARPSWPVIAVIWWLLGMAYAGLVTPGGRLIRRSGREEDLPFLFAAQFSLSHVCWLLAYPVAGFLGAKWGMGAALIMLTTIALLSAALARWLWSSHDPEQIEHTHEGLAEDHPHLARGQNTHTHRYVIDEDHTRWPQ